MAATDMALTQSAVSHQIRALEDHLGARLFQRRHRGIEMTPEGRTFLEGVRAGFDSILLATERIRNQHRVGVLTVASPALLLSGGSCLAWDGSPRFTRTLRSG